jgi:hypothetical protein
MIVRLRERASARLRSAREQHDSGDSTRLILLAALYQDQLLDLENRPHRAWKRPAAPRIPATTAL